MKNDALSNRLRSEKREKLYWMALFAQEVRRMKKAPPELDAITDVVLAYKPKPKTKAAKRRRRKKKAADAKNTRESNI
jgi:hypothetical protein